MQAVAKPRFICKIFEIWKSCYSAKHHPVTSSLGEKCPNTEFFLVRIFPYSVRIRKNTDQKKLRNWTLHTVCIFYIQIEVNEAGERLPAILLLVLYSEIVAKNDKYIRFYFNILNIVCLRLLKSIKVVSTKPFWK